MTEKEYRNNPDKRYSPGDVVLYKRPDSEHYELGIVKSVDSRGAFVWYHMGDTAAKTNFADLRRISNEYAFDVVRKTVD